MAQKAFNSIFGKVGRAASEEVIVQLLKVFTVLYMDACLLNRDYVRSLDFAVLGRSFALDHET